MNQTMVPNGLTPDRLPGPHSQIDRCLIAIDFHIPYERNGIPT